MSVKHFLIGNENDGWQEHAACKEINTKSFFPEQGENYSSETKEALKACNRCKVRPQCLMHALNEPETYGIWGGISYRGRLRIMKKFPPPINIQQAVRAIEDHGRII